MFRNKFPHRTFALAAVVASVVAFTPTPPAQAGCGCDKPAPAQAAVIPHAAYPGMQVTLFDSTLQNGQTWTVTFQSGGKTASTTTTVVTKRALFDPSGKTSPPQLVVTVPKGLPMGPTQVTASKKGAAFVVPDSSFTLIGAPIMLTEGGLDFTVSQYTTGVGADGTVYMAIGGLDHVCKPSAFSTTVNKNYPLRFGVGDVTILNYQGFLIDVLDANSTNHMAITSPFLSPQSQSNTLWYYRHSFEAYCANHLPGGPKEIDPQDPNWHLDGTAHTNYSALIFAINGHFDDGTRPKPGSVTFDAGLLSWLGQPGDSWAPETQEETIWGSSGSSGGTTTTTTTTSSKTSKTTSSKQNAQ